MRWISIPAVLLSLAAPAQAAIVFAPGGSSFVVNEAADHDEPPTLCGYTLAYVLGGVLRAHPGVASTAVLSTEPLANGAYDLRPIGTCNGMVVFETTPEPEGTVYLLSTFGFGDFVGLPGESIAPFTACGYEMKYSGWQVYPQAQGRAWTYTTAPLTPGPYAIELVSVCAGYYLLRVSRR